MSICLTYEEIFELTGRKHCDAQRTALVRMGIDHIVRPDGSLVVSRALVNRLLGVEEPNKVPPSPEPDWDACRGVVQPSRTAQPDWDALYAQERQRIREKKASAREKQKAIREKRRAIQAATIAELKARS